MAWSLVQSKNTTPTTSTSLAAAFGSNVTAGNRIILYTGLFAGVVNGTDVNTPTDNQGNTYTKLVSGTITAAGVTQFTDIWTAVAGSTGTLTVTVTAAAQTGLELAWTAEEYSGLDGSAGTGCLDKSAAGTGNNNSTANASSGTTAATTGANQLAVSAVSDWGTSATWTVSSGGFTKNAGASIDANATMSVGAGNKTSASGATENCTWTNGAVADTDVAVVAVIKLAATSSAVPATPGPPYRLRTPRWRRAHELPYTTPQPPTVTAFPPQSSRPRPPRFPVRRGEANWPAPQVVIQAAAFPPQSAAPRRRAPFRRRPTSTQPLAAIQAFPPQSSTRRRFPFFRRETFTSLPPLIAVTPRPPQAATRPRRFGFRRRGFSSAPPPPTVAVTVYPFQQPSPRRKPWLPPVRRGRSVPPPAPSVTVTVYPYPPQGGRPRGKFPLRTAGGFASLPPLPAAGFPPQSTRRRVWPFRRRGYSSAPPPTQVVFTIYPYPVPSRRRRWWPPLRRRGTSTPPTPAAVIAVGVPPFTVTATDQPAVAVTAVTAVTAAVTSTDQPATSVTSSSTPAVSVTAADQPLITVT